MYQLLNHNSSLIVAKHVSSLLRQVKIDMPATPLKVMLNVSEVEADGQRSH